MVSKRKDFPKIPNIPKELRLPISSLVRVGILFRGVLVQMVEGKPWEEISDERGECLELGEKVLTEWIKKMGIDEEEDSEMN